MGGEIVRFIYRIGLNSIMREDILEEIGLTKSEIKVYMALLELGSSATGKIVDKSKASSSKIYEILDKLMQKGLVSFIVKSGVKYFEAAPPERIMDYMKEKEERFDKQKEEMKRLLPELELKQKLAQFKSEATIFKGLKGGETAFRYMINNMKKGDEWVGFVVSFANQRYFDLLIKLHEWRSKKKLRSRIIMAEKYRIEGLKREKLPFTEVKYVPEDMQTPAIINVAGNITLLNIMGEEVTVFMIENKDVADSFRSQFEKMWGQKIFTYQGIEQIKSLMRSSLEFGDYDVFAEGMKIYDVLGEEFFVWWQDEKKRRGIRSRGIIREQYRNLPIVTRSATQFRFSHDFESPGSKLIFKDKVINLMLSEEPVAFLVDNKDIADSNRAYFELVWNQDVVVRKGIKNIENTFDIMLDELDPGEEYYVLGASWMGFKDRAFDYFVDFHKRRQKKGVKAKFLFISGTEKTIEKYKESYSKLTEVKYLPPNVYEGMQINIYKNKVLFFVWREDDPLVFSIEDKTTHDTFKTYFDTLWNTSGN